MHDQDFEKEYLYSIKDPDNFWADVAKRQIDWVKPFTKTCDATFQDPYIFKWFEDGILNVSYNCIDRHLPLKRNDIALIWQGDTIDEQIKINFQTLFNEVNAFAAYFKSLGIRKGDVVTIYLPMIPEAVYAMLACSRIGAVHSVVFGGFSGEALSRRINDAKSKWLITANYARRGGKEQSFKPLIDDALKNNLPLEKIIIIDKSHSLSKHYSNATDYYTDIKHFIGEYVEPEPMHAEDPLFILYTSGSTGKPKGLVHTTAGYLVYIAYTFKTVFDYQPGDIHWCTADIGWITGHSYVVYAPLANGATTVIYEGIPNQPKERIWEIIDKHQINILYTAPTLIRALMQQSVDLDQYSLASLKLLGTVGEPINPEAWRWYRDNVGQGKLPVVDTWWQTETGGIMLSPTLHDATQKPGATDKARHGIEPKILRENLSLVTQGEEGALCIAKPWPGIARTILGAHERYVETYFSKYPGYYFSGDGAKQDPDGSIWVTGRMDDIVNVAGHRLSTAEIESALVAHPAVCEAAVIGIKDSTKGQSIGAFVILHPSYNPSENLSMALTQTVVKAIGPIAKPSSLYFCTNLPKTRSGKIMRRLIKKIADGEQHALGDTSTLLNPEIIQELIAHFHSNASGNSA